MILRDSLMDALLNLAPGGLKALKSLRWKLAGIPALICLLAEPPTVWSSDRGNPDTIPGRLDDGKHAALDSRSRQRTDVTSAINDIVADPDGPGSPNGLGTPRAIDIDGNGTADYVYAGDDEGNLFRFDITGREAGDRSVHRLFQASYDPDGNPLTDNRVSQRTTTQPIAVRHPLRGVIVIFATGSFITLQDDESRNIESIYGIWDQLTDEFIRKSQLVRNRWVNAGVASMSEGVEVRVRTLKGPADFGEEKLDYGTGKHRGWYMDFDMPAPGAVEGVGDPEFPGETALRRMHAKGSRIFVNSVIPRSRGFRATNTGGALLAFCAVDGLDHCFRSSAFDLDGNGTFDEATESGDKISGILIEGDAVPTDGDFVGNRLMTRVGDDLLVIGVDTGRVRNTGRLSWKQIGR